MRATETARSTRAFLLIPLGAVYNKFVGEGRRSVAVGAGRKPAQQRGDLIPNW